MFDGESKLFGVKNYAPVEDFPMAEGDMPDIAEPVAMPGLEDEGFKIAAIVDFPPPPHAFPDQRISYNHAVRLLGYLTRQYGSDNVRCVEMPWLDPELVDTRVEDGSTALMVRIVEQTQQQPRSEAAA